jgi:TolB protein
MSGRRANRKVITTMTRYLTLCLLVLLTAAPALAVRELGTLEVNADNRTLPVRVSADAADLNSLAQLAFGSHGRYRVVASNFVYDIRFSSAGPTQVRVDISRGGGGAVVYSQVVSGASRRAALLEAADVAVAKTNGQNLRGYFSSRLVFIGERTGHKEIYTADLFFGEVRQVTHDNAIAMTPRWAPDGERVIYTSYFKSGFPDIFTIDFSTFQRSTFASFKGTNSGAQFSPDGRSVAMVLSGEGQPEIYTCNAYGRGVVRRTNMDTTKSSPCWSPDGGRLVFAMEPGPQLYVMGAAGGYPQRVTHDTSRYCAEPDWSHGNPNKIAFTMGVGRNFQIGVLDLSTGHSEQVSKASFDGVEPCWLPDGRHLVYSARSASMSRICILDTETGKSTPVSPSAFGPALQANVWAPR